MQIIIVDPDKLNNRCYSWDLDTEIEKRCKFYDKTLYTEWCNHPSKHSAIYCAIKQCKITQSPQRRHI